MGYSLSRSLTSKAKSLKRDMGRRIKPMRLAWLERQARDKIHWVSSARIRFVSLKTFPSSGNGEVVGGDWDELSRPFETTQSDHSESGARTEAELLATLRQVEDIYHLARNSGRLPLRPGSVVAVNVGRDGDLLLNEGKELLSVAKLLGLPRIPVVVVVRHPEWMVFRKQLRRDPRGSYSPLLHPDLEWLPSETGHQRFDLIRSALVARGGRMLDIGCNWGYFCQRFEDIGFDCIGVEPDARRYYFLQRLKRAGDYRFETVNASIFDFVSEPREYEVVLALSILHHFIQTKDQLDQLKRLLGRLRTREMFFMPSRPSEEQMQRAYWNPSENEFAAFVVEHSGLRRAVCLGRGGRAETRRALYHLTA